MKNGLVLLLFTAVVISVNAQSSKKTIAWTAYIQPVLDSIYTPKEKKVIVADYFLIKERNGPSFDSILNADYGLSPEKWSEYWSFWKANNYYHPDWDWEKRLSSEERNKSTRSKKWRNGKIAVISVSKPIFLTETSYILEITEYCPGLCSITVLYFVDLDSRKSKRCTVKHRLEIGVS